MMLTLASMLALSVTQLPAQNVRVAVFRHHPLRMTNESREQADARNRDAEVIRKAASDAGIEGLWTGGFGSGFELRIKGRDVGAWQDVVAKLREAKSLKQYTDWQMEDRGFGLLPLGNSSGSM